MSMNTNKPMAKCLSTRHSRRTLLAAGAASLAMPIQPTLARSSNAAWTSVAMHLRRQGSIKLQATVWLGDQEFQAMQELGSRYTANHPEIEIEFVNIVDGGPYGRDQLQRMIAGGSPPDLMMMNTGQFEAFGSRQALADLEERIAGDSLDMGVYFPAAVEGCKIDGKVYGLPKDISDVIMYLNTDFFAEAGVDLPTNEWDWNEYREIAKALTRDTDGDGQVDKWGASIQNSVWSWAAFVFSNGGSILNDDKTECMLTMEESVEALKVYYGVLTEDLASVPPGALPQAEGAGEQFLSGLVGINMAGPWYRPNLVENDPFNWTVRNYPRTPGGDASTGVLYIDQWAMSSKSKNPDDAWGLLKFLAGPEGQTIWSEIYGSRSITPIQELALSDAWLGYGGPEHREDNQLILDQLARTVPPPTNFGDGAEVENIWNEQFELVIVGQQDVDQATQMIVDMVNPILQQP